MLSLLFVRAHEERLESLDAWCGVMFQSRTELRSLVSRMDPVFASATLRTPRVLLMLHGWSKVRFDLLTKYIRSVKSHSRYDDFCFEDESDDGSLYDGKLAIQRDLEIGLSNWHALAELCELADVPFGIISGCGCGGGGDDDEDSLQTLVTLMADVLLAEPRSADWHDRSVRALVGYVARFLLKHLCGQTEFFTTMADGIRTRP